MNAELREDLKRHKQLAFRRMRLGADLMKKYHKLPEVIRNREYFKRAYQWLSVPFSLWPVDIIGAVGHLIELAKSGKQPSAEIIQLIELLGGPPSAKTCASINEHEHSVKYGNYETLIRAQHKFDFKEEVLMQNPGFLQDWKWIKTHFDVTKFQSSNGVIRRRMVFERNFRPPDWDFQWKAQTDKFRNVFDAFCHKWVLYGMERDKPLLQKLTVNVTPYGTMIVIPRYWSFDGHRDLKWRATTRLHHSRGVSKQGIKLRANQRGRRKQADAARAFFAQATQLKMKGEKRDDWVIAKLGLHPETDRKQLWRLLKRY
jgi:hypothetical protein